MRSFLMASGLSCCRSSCCKKPVKFSSYTVVGTDCYTWKNFGCCCLFHFAWISDESFRHTRKQVQVSLNWFKSDALSMQTPFNANGTFISFYSFFFLITVNSGYKSIYTLLTLSNAQPECFSQYSQASTQISNILLHQMCSDLFLSFVSFVMWSIQISNLFVSKICLGFSHLHSLLKRDTNLADSGDGMFKLQIEGLVVVIQWVLPVEFDQVGYGIEPQRFRKTILPTPMIDLDELVASAFSENDKCQPRCHY